MLMSHDTEDARLSPLLLEKTNGMLWSDQQTGEVLDDPPVVLRPQSRKTKSTMGNSIKGLRSRDWSFTTAITNEWTHDLHPYPAKFIPQIPRTLIEALSKPGETILDPFCGGGTTLVEATIAGRNAIGSDSNPLAVLITRAKTLNVDENQLAQLRALAEEILAWSAKEAGRDSLFDRLSTAQLEPSVPDIPNLEHWFTKQVSKELGLARAAVERIRDMAVRTAAEVALSRIIVRVSNQDSETRYSSREKNIGHGESLKLFGLAIRDACEKLASYREVRKPVNVSVIGADARELLDHFEKASVDLVVTSPPYPNAFDYHLYHRHRLFWLGYDPRKVMKVEIGSHLNYQRSTRDGIGIFSDDMIRVFHGLRPILRPKAYCCFVIGDSVFKGEVHDNARLLAKIGKDAGFSIAAEIKRKLPASKRSFAMPARRLIYEHIVVFQNR